ncbi:MAG: CBS domain-containing protein [Promethearchaeia archaeon]
MGTKNIEQFGELKVKDVMIKEPYFTYPDEKISKTELYMLKKKIGGLPVINDVRIKQVIGIITQRDIRLARFALSLDSPYTLVRDLMTANPYCAKEDNTIKGALEKMFKYSIERLPVVDDDDRLVGLLLQKQILRVLYDYLIEDD